MMQKKTVILLGLLFSLSISAEPMMPEFSWRYGTGSNIDSFCTTKAVFYQQGRITFSYPGGGCNAGAPHNYITDKKYYWGGSSGISVDSVPVPDKALIEIVSFYDRKRYRVEVDLPADLEKQMRKVYLVQGRLERRERIYFGLAPGGYYEVLLKGRGLGVSPDLLISNGIAKEVTDYWYDKKYPIGIGQYSLLIREFDQEYSGLFTQHPIPTGMEWAPIMDAYRAKQPKTDQHPVE